MFLSFVPFLLGVPMRFVLAFRVFFGVLFNAAMADKVRQRGEAISLEPMPASERRVIHMALRDAPDVYTESLGEGRQRRVRIFPKR